MTYEIVESILNAHCGAEFLKADLHIHTPASSDWDDKNPDPAFHSSNIKPEMIVEAALAAGLDLIAITDHNSVAWCGPVMQAAEGKGLTVLPGFELTVRPGVHVLALFDSTMPVADLRDLLIKLDIAESSFGDAEAMTGASIDDMESKFKPIRQLQDAGAMVIPAHIDQDSGLVGRLKGGTAAKDFLERAGCHVLEIAAALPPLVEAMLKVTPDRFAVIVGSDAHRLDQIGTKPIWLKMDTPSLGGLEQIAFEPHLRIQNTPLMPNKKPKILGMYANGGLLAGQVFRFCEDLNCLIGGRGAGKSAVIDHLRFVFGDMPLDEVLKRKFARRLVDLVREATTVYILSSDGEQNLWLHERTMSYREVTSGSKTTYEVLSGPAIVHQVISEEQRLIKLDQDAFAPRVEFYGQGEVQSITDTAEPSRQLNLVDEFARDSIRQRMDQAAALEVELDDLESGITEIDTEAEELEVEILQLKSIKQRIGEIEQELERSKLEEHQVWDDANTWLIKAVEQLESQQEKLALIGFEAIGEKTFDIPESEAQEALDAVQAQVKKTSVLIREGHAQLKDKVEQGIKALATLRAVWEGHYADELARYVTALRNQGFENLSALNRELAEKKQQRDEIETSMIPRRDALEASRKQLADQRVKKLQALETCWNELRECRVFAAKEMTSRLGGSVAIRISDRRNLNEYQQYLDGKALSGIRSRAVQLQTIVEALTPRDLARAIREKDIGQLIACGVTEHSATTLCLLSPRDVMGLERVRCDDLVQVVLISHGKERHLEELSVGEMSTAILSIILLDASRPLVIDQPEDELDHEFIMSGVVGTLARMKQKSDALDLAFVPRTGRQFIIATHDQNIPVLGDAELVLKMRKKPGENCCEAESAFGLEHPETIKHVLNLEGGREAFQRRSRKYWPHFR